MLEAKVIIANRVSSGATKHEDYFLWCQVVCSYDACRMEGLELAFHAPVTEPVYFYADDMNTEVTKDYQGYALSICSVPDLIEHLKYLAKKHREVREYRRFKPLLALLESFDLTEWDDLIAIYYGY